jgi:hypothetical protein
MVCGSADTSPFGNERKTFFTAPQLPPKIIEHQEKVQSFTNLPAR